MAGCHMVNQDYYTLKMVVNKYGVDYLEYRCITFIRRCVRYVQVGTESRQVKRR